MTTINYLLQLYQLTLKMRKNEKNIKQSNVRRLRS